MAAAPTLDRTRPEVESCSSSCSDESPEIPSDEEDTAGRRGLVSSGMEVTLGTQSTGDPMPPVPPAADRLPRSLAPIQTRPFRTEAKVSSALHSASRVAGTSH